MTNQPIPFEEQLVLDFLYYKNIHDRIMNCPGSMEEFPKSSEELRGSIFSPSEIRQIQQYEKPHRRDLLFKSLVRINDEGSYVPRPFFFQIPNANTMILKNVTRATQQHVHNFALDDNATGKRFFDIETEVVQSGEDKTQKAIYMKMDSYIINKDDNYMYIQNYLMSFIVYYIHLEYKDFLIGIFLELTDANKNTTQEEIFVQSPGTSLIYNHEFIRNILMENLKSENVVPHSGRYDAVERHDEMEYHYNLSTMVPNEIKKGSEFGWY